MDRETLRRLANMEPRELWQLKPYEISPEYRGERELAIRDKAVELARRNAAVEHTMADVYDLVGVYSNQSDPVELNVMADANTGETYSAQLSLARDGAPVIDYFITDSNGVRRPIPQAQEYHRAVFMSEGYSELTLDLTDGRVIWSEEVSYDIDPRSDILMSADSTVSGWEGTASMLMDIIRNPALNPEIAAEAAHDPRFR